MSKMLKIDSGEKGLPSYWQCTDCEYSSPHCGTMKRHIESKHVLSDGFNCPECSYHVPTWNALKQHQRRTHPSTL